MTEVASSWGAGQCTAHRYVAACCESLLKRHASLPTCNPLLLQKAREADLHRLAGALLDYETLSTSEIRQV